MKKVLAVISSGLALGGFVFLFIHFSRVEPVKTDSTLIRKTEAATDAAPVPKAAPSDKIEEKENQPKIAEKSTSSDEDSSAGETVPSPADNSAETPAPAAVKASIPAAKYPAQVLSLANWKQTLPTGSSGSPTEIKQTMLATYSNDACFHVNSAADGVIFRAPVNGVTTSGSGYPRSELREMANNGKSNASWSTDSGAHTMFIDQAIMAVPKNKKHVVAGQIHDANDDVIVIRLEYPKLFIDINGVAGPTLDPSYTLGKRFTIKFAVEKGQIKIYYNGNQKPAYTLNKKLSGCYFKAGAYTQSNCSKEKDCSSGNYGEVAIYKLDVQH